MKVATLTIGQAEAFIENAGAALDAQYKGLPIGEIYRREMLGIITLNSPLGSPKETPLTPLQALALQVLNQDFHLDISNNLKNLCRKRYKQALHYSDN